MMPALSLCVITRDAAVDLADCLASAAFAAEMVVVDSGSIDDTVEIAHRHGARVIHQPWLGFGPQKNFATAQARHDWVLCLDADERLSPELAVSIRRALEERAGKDAKALPVAYAMARRNRFLGRWLAHGEGYPDWNTRLFDRRHARWSEDAVHEHVEAEGSVAHLSGDLLHASAESLEHYLDKQNRYTTLQAQAMYARGERSSAARIVLSPLVRFIRFYFFRRGWLDGLPGLVHIVIGCGASFIKYAKLREHSARKRV
ncbi:MAG: glycosyltransferase family 2 protein [Betaproteobacteria bacterium]